MPIRANVRRALRCRFWSSACASFVSLVCGANWVRRAALFWCTVANGGLRVVGRHSPVNYAPSRAHQGQKRSWAGLGGSPRTIAIVSKARLLLRFLCNRPRGCVAAPTVPDSALCSRSFLGALARRAELFSTLKLRATSGATSTPAARHGRGGHVPRRTLASVSAPQQTHPCAEAASCSR